MRAPLRTGFAMAAALCVSTGSAQLTPTPKINEKGPAKLVPPTPTPGPRLLDPGARGPKELPPTPTHAPTRTPTATPAPPAVRNLDVRPGEIVVKKQSAPSGCTTKVDSPNPTQTFVQIRCPLAPPTGLTADFEFWRGVRLKNGWRVDSLKADWSGSSNPQPPDNSHTGFRISTAPVVGSDNPEMTLHLFATPGLTIDVEVVLRVKGPAGTSPR